MRTKNIGQKKKEGLEGVHTNKAGDGIGEGARNTEKGGKTVSMKVEVVQFKKGGAGGRTPEQKI